MSLSKLLPPGRTGKRAGKRVSIRDVAATVGVSISTVSRALRGYADVSPGTRERVQRAALELGYTPDAAGQMLKSGRTETVAVLVSGRHGPTFLDAFYAEVVGGLEAHLTANGLSLLLLRADSVNPGWVQGRCDGVVALGCDLPAALLRELEQRLPLVLVDSAGGWRGWRPEIPSVTVANEAGGYEATRHLFAKGRRGVAFIAEVPHDPNFLQRRRGYLRAHAEADKEALPERQQTGRLGPDGGYLATQKLLTAAPFDAVFAANDMAAFGALRALAEVGMRVPDDVAVVGFDDIALARYSHPPLTTLQIPRQQLGTEAATQLLARLGGQPTTSPELPVSLVIRSSS